MKLRQWKWRDMHWLEKYIGGRHGHDCGWLNMEGKEDRRAWDDIQVSDLGNQVDDRGNHWGKGRKEEGGFWGWEMWWDGDDDSFLDMLILRCSWSIHREISVRLLV